MAMPSVLDELLDLDAAMQRRVPPVTGPLPS
jgi:hypothetical protein